jgi:hypothetical protein
VLLLGAVLAPSSLPTGLHLHFLEVTKQYTLLPCPRLTATTNTYHVSLLMHHASCPANYGL